jgi:DNA repair exonuclease SbcCD ATPase subunit
MMNDMEEFARELQAAKLNISTTQEVMIGTIRDRLQSTYSAWENEMSQSPKRMSRTQTVTHDKQNKNNNDESDFNNNIETLLAETDCKSISELMNNVQLSEEQIFGLYKNIQILNEDLEKIEMENRRLEQLAETQMSTLETLEGNNDKVSHELESHLNQIQKSIAQQEKNYNENLQILNNISDSLFSILKNVSICYCLINSYRYDIIFIFLMY